MDDAKMLDVTFYRDAVLEIVETGQHIAREVYELRYSLFLRAARHFYNNRSKISDVFEPFPHCFFDCVHKKRNYDELQASIESIPALSTIGVSFPFYSYKKE